MESLGSFSCGEFLGGSVGLSKPDLRNLVVRGLSPLWASKLIGYCECQGKCVGSFVWIVMGYVMCPPRNVHGLDLRWGSVYNLRKNGVRERSWG